MIKNRRKVPDFVEYGGNIMNGTRKGFGWTGQMEEKRNYAGIEKYEFQDLFDMEEVQRLTDALSMALEVGVVIVSPSGVPITKPSNFCNFCMNIVRKTEIGRKNCEYSDSVLGKRSDKPITSRCLSAGLVDAGVSIVIDGKHLASWIIGQVMIEGEEMAEEEQRERAKLLGIDEELFMESIKEIPRKTKEQHQRILDMVQVMAMQLSELGLKSYMQKEELIYRVQLEEDLQREKAHLEYFSKYDELTGVFSRNYYEEALDEVCTKGEYPIAIISGDMNNLKLMNDVFGHQHGDEMLRNVGEILRQEAKQTYLIGRCGGDEFNIAVPFAREEDVKSYCERVRLACEETRDCMIPPSVALGYEIMTSAYENVRDVTKAAEEKMYKLKMKKKLEQNINDDILEVLYRKEYIFKEEIEEATERLMGFAAYLGLGVHDRGLLRLSLQLKDIGMIAVPEHVVKQRAKRNAQERACLEKHPEIGYRLAKLYDESYPVANIILQSRECWDGSGYPSHLKGDEILYIARILYIVGEYSYWIYDKAHRVILEPRAARRQMREKAGTQFDPVMVEQFLEYLEKAEPLV